MTETHCLRTSASLPLILLDGEASALGSVSSGRGDRGPTEKLSLPQPQKRVFSRAYGQMAKRIEWC